MNSYLFNKQCTDTGTRIGTSMANALNRGADPLVVGVMYKRELETAYNTINQQYSGSIAQSLMEDVKFSSGFALRSNCKLLPRAQF